MKELILDLPMPPTANHMFATGGNGRRFKSKKYADWLKEAGWVAKAAWQAAGSPKFHGPLFLKIELGLQHDADISNRIKPLEDLLVKSIPDFPDDMWNDRIEVTREQMTGARVTVRPL